MQILGVPEAIIHMAPVVRDQVMAGHLNRVWRPGHRNYEVGPAMIRFQDGEIIHVQILEVKHSTAEGRNKEFMDALRRLDQPAPENDEITMIRFELEEA